MPRYSCLLSPSIPFMHWCMIWLLGSQSGQKIQTLRWEVGCFLFPRLRAFQGWYLCGGGRRGRRGPRASEVSASPPEPFWKVSFPPERYFSVPSEDPSQVSWGRGRQLAVPRRGAGHLGKPFLQPPRCPCSSPPHHHPFPLGRSILAIFTFWVLRATPGPDDMPVPCPT